MFVVIRALEFPDCTRCSANNLPIDILISNLHDTSMYTLSMAVLFREPVDLRVNVYMEILPNLCLNDCSLSADINFDDPPLRGYSCLVDPQFILVKYIVATM